MKNKILAASKQLESVSVLVEEQQSTDFWFQCVRDAKGKWLKYAGYPSENGVSYFRGHQPAVNYCNPEEVKYLHLSIETRKQFYEGLLGLEGMMTNEFKEWLVSLRKTLEYRKVDEWFNNNNIAPPAPSKHFSTSAHTKIIKQEVIPVAITYSDTYAFHITKGPIFYGFPKEALPTDEIDGENIVHHYPVLKYSELYLSNALDMLKQIIFDKLGDDRDYIYKIAYFFQLLINLHYFAAINAGLYMNMANALLEIKGIKGIENGIVDFVALRLQPGNFKKYFYDEVKLENDLE